MSDRTGSGRAGRPFAAPLLIRVVAAITYLRLHLAQEFIGMWFGIDQVQISRDLRRLLPLIRRHVLRCRFWSCCSRGRDR